ncbi:hypothetical protein Lal_00036504 [Lupinus albus]|uniref:Putative chromatin regulator PHD family n=1 Tax=Lupinus albus TaxID=3870 RepID=A0A6A5P4M8_LUPAL|nr:putative chromatin regulator PHD family [Lupinus albus]KAF1892148.1 hypothetical protein Lal_00036504 [Lupinus albus]
MVRGGKVSCKSNFRLRIRSKKGGGSDDSDEDYVISDEGGDVSDCPEDYGLDECASEESFDGFIEEEEETRRVRKFNRSKAKNSNCGVRGNASKISRKRSRIIYAEQLELQQKEREGDGDEEENDEDEDFNYDDDEGEEEEEDEDEDKDFNYDDDEEFTPEEEYCSDVEEETRGRNKKNNGVKMGKKVLKKRVSVTSTRDRNKEDEYEDLNYDDDDDDEEFTLEEEYCSDVEEETRRRKKKNSVKRGKKVLRRGVSTSSTRGRKRRRSRASKNPSRKKRRKNGGLRRKVRSNEVDDFIDNGTATRKKSRKILVRVRRRRVLLEGSNSDSDHVSGSPDYKFTVSEEEREQVREAKELCRSLRRNLRSSSLQMKNAEVRVHEDLQHQWRPPGWKGKEKIEEPQGRKGKEKVEDLKSEMGKQVCGICLSEENTRRVRGVLNCCTHYFCFACIMEWAKVESRCPLCKQRFKTITKPAQSKAGLDLRESVIQVPECDQVYQPSEEELMSYIDPYESVICSECHQGGDDGLMLLCDMCDSPAHTYCVGLGREVPEGNWYCDGCKPVAVGSSGSQVQLPVASRMTIQSPLVRPSPVHVPESIDFNLISSPRTPFSEVFGHLSSSRFSGIIEAASPVSGGGTLPERHRILCQFQQLPSVDRMNSTTGNTNGISVTTSTSNLCSSQIDQSRETAIQHPRTLDVGTSCRTFFEERLCNNVSPSMQNGDPFSMGISISRRPVCQDSTTMFTDKPVNEVLWPAHVEMPGISDFGPVCQFSSRSNMVTDGNLSGAIKEESNFPLVKEQLQSMVKSHLKRFSRDVDVGYSIFKDIARSSTHTILAACGLEHKRSEVCTVPPPCICPHIELMGGGEKSLIQGCCSSCFDSFVGDVVKRVLETRMSLQLRFGL